MDTFESLKKIWEECELASIPQEAIQLKATEIFNLLNLSSDCILPTIYLSKDKQYQHEDLFFIEWANQGLFCEFSPEYFKLGLLNNELQMEKKFESNKFLKILSQVVPLQSDVTVFKLWSEQKKSSYLIEMTMSTCCWIKIDNNEECNSNRCLDSNCPHSECNLNQHTDLNCPHSECNLNQHIDLNCPHSECNG